MNIRIESAPRTVSFIHKVKTLFNMVNDTDTDAYASEFDISRAEKEYIVAAYENITNMAVQSLSQIQRDIIHVIYTRLAKS